MGGISEVLERPKACPISRRNNGGKAKKGTELCGKPEPASTGG